MKVRESITSTHSGPHWDGTPKLSDPSFQLSRSWRARTKARGGPSRTAPAGEAFLLSRSVTKETCPTLSGDERRTAAASESRPLSKSRILSLYPSFTREAREPVFPEPEFPRRRSFVYFELWCSVSEGICDISE